MKLIISEKSIAGKRIASILSNNKYTENSEKGAISFSFTKNKIDYVLIPLKGHINTVDFAEDDSYWSIYGLTTLADKKLAYLPVEKKIISELKQKKDIDEIIIATDADREGEAIGVEAYNYLSDKNKSAKVSRAYFSALTEQEVNSAFSKLSNPDFNCANSVFARQEIDLLWGAIITRYLSVVANRKGKLFLSAGRVQTPLLNFIVARELERATFVPQPFAEIHIIFEKDKMIFEGEHKNGKMFEVQTAEKIFEKIKSIKEGIVKGTTKKEKIIPRPDPFNTTSFLRAANALGVGTNQAMDSAEWLYQNGFISYPRTDNTVYPESIDFKGILEKLSTITELKKDIKEILSKPINPSKGNKKTTDHPPIHPVAYADKLTGLHQKIYYLIVRRFLATLSTDAKTENISAIIEINKELFSVTGQRIIDAGWKKIYIYSKLNEVLLPELKTNDIVKIIDKKLEKKETTPPPRYTEGGLIKLMEEENLGTKSTRPAIIQKLKDRDYIIGQKNIEATKIAISVCSVLEKHCEQITKPVLTANTEVEMDKIAAGKKNKDAVVDDTRKKLKEIIKILLEEKDKIASELRQAITNDALIGKCNLCGKNLIIRHSKIGKQFVGCTGYPACKNTFPLPQSYKITATNEVCQLCSTPIVKAVGRKTFQFCINPQCKSKEQTEKEMKDSEETIQNTDDVAE